MSIVGDLVDSAVQVVSVEAGGLVLSARVRRATAGELIEIGAAGVLSPEAPKKKAPVDDRTLPELHVKAAAFYAGLLRVCVMAVGKTATTLEPVTITLSDSERPRVGTAALPLYALPADVANALAAACLEATTGEAYRERVSTFLGAEGGKRADRRDGEAVQPATDSAA